MKTVTPKQLLSTLVDNKLLEEADSNQILQANLRQKVPLMQAIAQKPSVNLDFVAHILSRLTQLPLLDINCIDSSNLPKNTVDIQTIRQHKILPIHIDNKQLLIVITEPSVIHEVENITAQSKLAVKFAIANYKIVNQLIDQHHPASSMPKEPEQPKPEEKKEPTKITTDLSDSKLDMLDIQQDQDSQADTSEFPVVRFINKVILDSINKKASDIHFEPFESNYRVRIRVDGVLCDLAEPDSSLAPRLSARLKVMAGLDISERRIPQDGRFKINVAKGSTIGFRVSTCPTLFGEKIVLRILDPQTVNVGVDALGFEPEQKKLFLETIHRHQGMLLVTGPTGSGKTVSLYTALNLLNDNEKNISTAEDPVEIYLPGVNQVNINPKTGLDFASVLRAFLRQDPDIIMLGEIRDHETAEIAMKAAQTGHLVLSTLHTNGAAETLTRMENMGVSGFNIATSVSLVIAQRLVRKLCEDCKQPHTFTNEALLAQGFNEAEIPTLEIYQPQGCDNCTKGYRGRIAIFEVLALTPEICDIIMGGGSSFDIMNKSVEQGMLTLRQSGLKKVRQGVTSLEQVNLLTE